MMQKSAPWQGKRLRKALGLYAQLLRANMLCEMQYKGWPVMLVQVAFVVISDPISLIFLFTRFGSIGIWSVERVLLLYAMAVTSYGLAETFCRGFDYFPSRMVKTGDFDRLLLRPAPLSVQVAGSFFHIHRMARAVSGLVCIFWCLRRQGIPIGAGEVLLLLLALCSGFLLYTGVLIFTSGLAIFTVESLDWIYIFTNASYQITRCPVDYQPRTLRRIFTCFMPVLMVTYYPASVLCAWGEPLWKGLLCLPAALLFLLLSGFIWRFGVRHYRSTGS